MMSGSLRASCPACGEVEVRGVDVTIRCRVETRESRYRFQCPRCERWAVKNAGPNVITLLLRNGARVERWSHALELDGHPDQSVAPLNEADLAGFLAFLEQLPTAGEDALQPGDERTRD
jgi:hypothetical protein